MFWGAAMETTIPVGRAPIAATSERLVAAALIPNWCGVDHSKRKSGPCTIMSVVMTKRPSGALITALSSPGPTIVKSEWGKRGKMRARIADSGIWPNVAFTGISLTLSR